MCFCCHHLFASSHLFWIDFLFLTLFLFSLFVLFSEQVIERTIAKWNSQRPGMASSFCWLTNIVILRTERIRWSCSGSVMNFTNRNVKRKWRQWKEIALELLFLMIHTYICRCARHSHEDDNNNSELDFFFSFLYAIKKCNNNKIHWIRPNLAILSLSTQFVFVLTFNCNRMSLKGWKLLFTTKPNNNVSRWKLSNLKDRPKNECLNVIKRK